MEIPLFVVVLQIGFNAALNNRGYNGNPLIPSPRFVNSGQTRRLPPDSDSFVPLSSRGIPGSDSAQSDDEYTSFEDYSYRSVRPNQRQNDYLRYNTGPENDVSLESAPFGKMNSNNFVDSLQSSPSLSRRTDPNYRRPYLRNGPSNLRQGPSRNYYRKVSDDLSLEVSSLENSNPEDASRLGDQPTNYLGSLLSYIEPPNNRRGQNRKYYRKANIISPDESPIDKLDPDEDAVNSLLSSPYRRRNHRKEYNNHQYDLPASRIHEPSPVKDIPDAYEDTILLVTDDDKPDEIPIGRPKLGNPEQTGNNNLYNRRHGDGLNLDDEVSNNLSPFGGLKSRLRSRKLTNDSPLTQKFNRKSNDNSGLESSSNDELFPDDDKTEQLTLLRLASLENLDLDSSLLRSGDRKNHNNRKSNRRNFLRLSLSPNNKLTLDEGVASELSDLLSKTLDELNLLPVSLRRTGPSNNKYSRRQTNKLGTEEDNLSKIPVLRLGSVDIPNGVLTVQRYHDLANRSNNRNLRKHGNNRKPLKNLFDDNIVKNLVPHHEVKNNKLPNSRRNKKLNNNRIDDFSGEFSLDTLFNFQNEDHDDRLDDENCSSDLSALRSTNQNHLSLEPPLLRSSDENPSKSKDTDDTLHLEFPWNDALSSDNEKSSKLSALRSKSQLRNSKEKDNAQDTTDILHLEYPWNYALSSDNDKRSKVTALRSKSQLRNSKEKDNAKDTTDILHLEYPWNDALTSKNDKSSKLIALRSKSQLRNSKEKDNAKDTTDVLHLEYPWNGALSSDNDERSKDTALRSKSQLRNSKEKDNAKDTTDVLHLEYPWNNALSSNNDKSSKLTAFRSKSQLRNSKEKDNAQDTTDVLHLEYPWNGALSSNNDKSRKVTALRSKSQLRNSKEKDNAKDTTDILHLEYPWNEALTSDNDKSSKLTALRSKSQLRNSKEKDNAKDTTDVLHLEYPWNVALSSDNDERSKDTALRSKSQLRNSKEKDNAKDTTDVLHLEYPWNDALSSNNDKSSKLTAFRSKSQLRNSKEKDNAQDTTDVLHLEYPWNGALSSNNDKSRKVTALRSKSQLRNSKEKYNAKDTTDILHLEYPWNEALTSDNDKSSKLTALRSKSQLRNSKEKDNAKDTTDVLHLEYPWNVALSSDNDERSKDTALRSKSQLRNSKEKDNARDTTDVLHLEYPWNDELSSDNDKISKATALRSKSQLKNSKEKHNAKDTSDILHLEFPWNDALSPDINKTGELKSHSLLRSKSDSRQDKEPKNQLKLEFSRNDKPSPDKPSSKKTAVRTPDPFYVHPYLRNRNIKKHPNYFKRSYDKFTEGIRLEKHKDSPSESRFRHSNRRFNGNRNLRVLPLAREDLENDTLFRDIDEDPSAVITFPLGRRPRTQSRGTPSLLTIKERPNDTEFLLKLNGDRNDRKTYNNTIIFPKN